MNFAATFYLVLFLVYVAGNRYGQYLLFRKAGRAGWEAFVPFFSDYVMVRLVGKPLWWFVLSLVPIIRTLMKVSLDIEFSKAYGKHSLKEQTFAVFFPFVVYPLWGRDAAVKYLGSPYTLPEAMNLYAQANPEEKIHTDRLAEQYKSVLGGTKDRLGKPLTMETVTGMPIYRKLAEMYNIVPRKSGAREWGDAFLFAGASAMIIRTFFMEAFMIPTSSMERTLLAGDFLFVSKYHYGVRMPMVPLSLPFVHNRIKIGSLQIPSYIDLFRLPYYRTPGLQRVQRNDIVVFNYPAHDVVPLRDNFGEVKPTTLKENYIKRCVGVPGDSLEVRQGVLYINGKPGYEAPTLQREYRLVTKSGAGMLDLPSMKKLGFRKPSVYVGGEVSEETENFNWLTTRDSDYRFNLLYCPKAIAEQVRALGTTDTLEEVLAAPGEPVRSPDFYPYERRKALFNWNMDNYGPLLIPKVGATVALNEHNFFFYKRAIEAYEGHEVDWLNGKAMIDGKEAKTYTFEKDYYWMMGDNRHNSEDSRVWGFVPEDHIVGKPVFVFFSFDSDMGLRLGRIGTHVIK